MDGAAAQDDGPQQRVHPPLGQPLGVLLDRGQPGEGILPDDDAVIAHHGNVLRHPPPHVPQGPDGPQGHHVADGENGGETGAARQQLLRGGVSLRHGIAAGLALPVHVEGQPQAAAGIPAAGEAAVADLGAGPVSAQEPDVPVALSGQQLDDLLRGLAVVGGKEGRLPKPSSRALLVSSTQGAAMGAKPALKRSRSPPRKMIPRGRRSRWSWRA